MEDSIKIDNVMIAANCNTTTNALDYNSHTNLVAYSAANSILLLEHGPVPKVLFSLRGHSDRVNALQWLTRNSLISVSTDKSWILWAYKEGSDPRDPLSWTYKRQY